MLYIKFKNIKAEVWIHWNHIPMKTFSLVHTSSFFLIFSPLLFNAFLIFPCSPVVFAFSQLFEMHILPKSFDYNYITRNTTNKIKKPQKRTVVNLGEDFLFKASWKICLDLLRTLFLRLASLFMSHVGVSSSSTCPNALIIKVFPLLIFPNGQSRILNSQQSNKP